MGQSSAHQIYRAAADFFSQAPGRWGSLGISARKDPDLFTLDDVLFQLSSGFPDSVVDDINRLMLRETGLSVSAANDLTWATQEGIIQLCKAISESGEIS